MRLIDADRLKEVFKRNTGFDFADIIDMQPTVNVLDKIRAEIIQERDGDMGGSQEIIDGFVYGCNMALEIIDKHIAGKEQDE